MGKKVAKKWIESIEDIYGALQYFDMRKVGFAKFQMEGPAKTWWRIVDERWREEGRQCTWSAFLEKFRKKFIPIVVQEKREEEFIYLK